MCHILKHWQNYKNCIDCFIVFEYLFKIAAQFFNWFKSYLIFIFDSCKKSRILQHSLTNLKTQYY